jgi:hypothetical protein
MGAGERKRLSFMTAARNLALEVKRGVDGERYMKRLMTEIANRPEEMAALAALARAAAAGERKARRDRQTGGGAAAPEVEGRDSGPQA